MRGVSSVAYHALLRLAYALDYESREEASCSLAYWASTFYPCPDFDVHSTPIEPNMFFDEIVKDASTAQIQETPSIDSRIQQVYRLPNIAPLWKPIQTSDPNPLEKMSALILETFAHTHHFTILHALTSCQALQVVLPYLGDPRIALSHYWHSVCAAYITVERSGYGVGTDTTSFSDRTWEEIFDSAVTSAQDLSSYEHTLKLAYSCWRNFHHSQDRRYVALAARESNKPAYRGGG
jgi:hypothetical protein